MNSTPYISVPELLAAPTGINWDTIPDRGATDAAKQAAYEALARRGTGWVNTAARQVLCATQDTDDLKVGSRRCGYRNGTLTFITRYSPILSLVAVSTSLDTLNWTTLQGDLSVNGPASFIGVSVAIPGGYVRAQYIHGFPNTELAGAVVSGATSLIVKDPTGISAGTTMTIYNGVDDEDVVVAGSYTSGATLPLVTPLLAAHAAKSRISAMPVQIREAAQLAVIHYVRIRGRASITVQPTGGARSIVAVNQLEEFTEAKQLLQPYTRAL